MTTQQFNIDWSKSHCGIKKAPFAALAALMPEVLPILETFPNNPEDFTWDVKVHLLMPRQYPCIPHWHQDNVPRVNGVQRHDLCDPNDPMYLWVSGAPLTQFKHGYVQAQKWHLFNQMDEHRGSPAAEFGWRCFIRATHQSIYLPTKTDRMDDYLRRHSQVYLDSETYQW